MANPEYHIQVAVADWLKGQRRQGNKVYQGNVPIEGLLFTHAYQGRNESEGFFLKNMGVRPGISDLLNWWEHPRKQFLQELSAKYSVDIPLYECGFLELKSADGVLSTPQKRIKWDCERLGVKWAMANSEDAAVAVYKKWGLKVNHDAVQKHDLRTWDEKKQDAFDIYKPIR